MGISPEPEADSDSHKCNHEKESRRSGSFSVAKKPNQKTSLFLCCHHRLKDPPIHQISGVLPSANIKFSKLIAKSRLLQITRTRLFGFGNTDARILPTSVAIPITAFTIPMTVSFPPFLESIIAGKAAS